MSRPNAPSRQLFPSTRRKNPSGYQLFQNVTDRGSRFLIDRRAPAGRCRSDTALPGVGIVAKAHARLVVNAQPCLRGDEAPAAGTISGDCRGVSRESARGVYGDQPGLARERSGRRNRDFALDRAVQRKIRAQQRFVDGKFPLRLARERDDVAARAAIRVRRPKTARPARRWAKRSAAATVRSAGADRAGCRQ